MIKNLKITKFRALENVDYDFKLINEIHGSNGAGKTTILDAILWVITDTTLIYGNDNDANIDTFKPNTLIDVELSFDRNKFRRLYGYKLQDDDTITSINAFYFNDRKCKSKTEYVKLMKEEFNLDKAERLYDIDKKFDLLTALIIPNVLSENVETKMLRALFDKLLNEDTKLYEKEKYKDLFEDLSYQKFNSSMLQTYYRQRTKVLNSEIDKLNAKIDSSEKAVDVTTEYEKLSRELQDLRLSMSIPENKKVSGLNEQWVKLNEKLRESKIKDYSNNPIQTQINELTAKKEELQNAKNELTIIYNTNRTVITKKTLEDESSKNRISFLKKQIAQLENGDKVLPQQCPKCGCIINQKEIDRKNAKDVEEKTEYTSEIERLNEKRKAIANDIELANTKEKAIISKGIDLKKQIEELQNKITSLKSNLGDYVSDETKQIEQDIENINSEIKKCNEDYEIEKKQYFTDYNAKESEINNRLLDLGKIKTNNAIIQHTIDEKKIKLREKEVIENRKVLLADYIKQERDTLKENCKKIFGDEIEYVLTENNKQTDGYKETCYAVFKGKSYNAWNTAERLKLSVMIIDKLKSFLDLKEMPIIFDVSDNIGDKLMSEISQSKTQMFYTSVAKEDNVTRTLITK